MSNTTGLEMQLREMTDRKKAVEAELERVQGELAEVDVEIQAAVEEKMVLPDDHRETRAEAIAVLMARVKVLTAGTDLLRAKNMMLDDKCSGVRVTDSDGAPCLYVKISDDDGERYRQATDDDILVHPAIRADIDKWCDGLAESYVENLELSRQLHDAKDGHAQLFAIQEAYVAAVDRAIKVEAENEKLQATMARVKVKNDERIRIARREHDTHGEVCFCLVRDDLDSPVEPVRVTIEHAGTDSCLGGVRSRGYKFMSDPDLEGPALLVPLEKP